MAIDIVKSNLPTFPSDKKQPRTSYRGSSAGSGYGENGSPLASSLTSVAASDRLSAVQASNPDPALAALAAGKPADVGSQTRDVGKSNVPNAHGQGPRAIDSGSPGGKVGGLTNNQSEPVRKP
jgi:hypothetical protein